MSLASSNYKERQQESPMERKAVPPGSLGLPLAGETLSFYKRFTMIQLHPFIKERAARYGRRTFISSILGRKAVVTTDTAVVSSVLAAEWSMFHISYPWFVGKLIGSSITATNQAEWKLMRQSVIALVQGNLKTRFLNTINSVITEEIATWDDTIFLAKKTKELALKTAYRVLLQNHELPPSLCSSFLDVADNVACLPVYFPGSSYYKAIKARQHILEELRKAANESKSEFIHTLRSRGVPNHSVPDVIGGVLFAAFETTGTAMSIAVKHIKDNPQVFHALKHEHRMLGSLSKLTWEDYKSLTFTHHVAMETLRFSNSAFALFRRALSDFVLPDGSIIPKDWVAILSIAGIHMDPQYFVNPEIFDPWRWEREVTSSAKFFAFGGGARQCPGKDVALLEIVTFIYRFLAHVRRWDELSDATVIFDGTVKLQDGLPIRLYKY